ncbi:MAG: guanylate cyclase, partial [Leptospiraceae bacterium]|nr:guanylate cyclase [Leptospiraceae bacterium]
AAFCALAGISLENARAYDELQKERNLLEERVIERTSELSEEKRRSDELLLNILPVEIADELKTRGEATTQSYEMVTVMFTDFKGFTQVAEKASPEELVADLDNCFYYFDEVIDRFRVEKIKTIGDSYMCAGGLPAANRTNPVDVILAALEISAFMNQMKDIKQGMNQPYWELRIGIHTGPLIAGVVGKRKFAYDIWGDTVNTASRMESSGVPGEINISSTTYNLVKEFFECEYRGKVAAKNKGE